MINRKTVFIIGAGASDDYGFPLGSGLRSEIADLMAFETDPPFRFIDADVEVAVNQAIQHRGPEEFSRDRMAQAATSIINGINEASSIDAFIETRQDDAIEILGKIAITRQILFHERESVLSKMLKLNRYSDPLDAKRIRTKIAASWISILSEIIFDRQTRRSLDTVFSNCAFIVFNYDRCLEVALARSIEMRFGVSVNRAQQVVEQATIIHPYGRVGDPFIKSPNHVRFGYGISGDLYELSKLIKTYSETIDSQQSRQIRESIASADDIIFLGFGFASQNIRLLTTGLPSQTERIFATTKGFSIGDIDAVAQRARSILSGQIYRSTVDLKFNTDDTVCSTFLDSCKMRLSAM